MTENDDNFIEEDPFGPYVEPPKPETWKVHPLAAIFPELPPAEYEELKADIKAHGLIQPIILADDLQTIIAGRTRYKICMELGREPYAESIHNILHSGSGRPDGVDLEKEIIDFIYSDNVLRRHLTDEQRLAVTAKLYPNLRKEAAERQKATQLAGKSSNGAPKTKSGKSSVRPNRPNRTAAEELASRAKAPRNKARQTLQIQAKAPEKLDEIASGKKTLKQVVAEMKDLSVKAVGSSGGIRPEKEVKEVAISFNKYITKLLSGLPAEGRRSALLQIVDDCYARLEKLEEAGQ